MMGVFKIETIRNFVDKVIEYICTAFVAIMTAMVTWQVITRYFLKKPSAITGQMSKYMFIWLVLLASAYVFGKKEHMSMVFFKEKFTGHAAKVVDLTVEIIVIVFALGILVVGGLQNTILTMGQNDSVLPITIGMIYAVLPISGILTVFYSICNIKDINKEYAQKELINTNDNSKVGR